MTAEIIPRTPVSIRVATMADLPFMDGLQRKYGRALGYFPTKQFEEYIETGGVLIAEEERGSGVGRRGSGEGSNSSAFPRPETRNPIPVGYCISRDRYLKRDELGVIYQLCVAPGLQRKLVGASLIREVFERSAYGCRLYCCWCAQDLEANYFWESLGFVPVAFRAGGAKKVRTCPERARASRRVHIFWQRRIHADDEATAY